ncbi:cytochrome c [Stenotrophomonas sp.]|uniref:cytochrome c n=1 Tax=Stenotrophomonas sp. TaxID=69392 RepID=UPI0028A7F2AB|nr:cytochrome c [Stenotrophomonas sp.]
MKWLSLPGLVLALMAAANVHADDAVERGRYLATAGDCMACHTKPNGGKDYAGGYSIASPMGEIWASNITPSVKFGIGSYSEADFERAVRQGIRKDGARLYPAMPYTSYAKLTDRDVRDLYAYFMAEVKPVEQLSPSTDLPFPFNVRLSMAGWNLLFLDRTPVPSDPSKSAQWNRGAYLVEGLEHCGSCHTPRGLMMQEKSGQALSGGSLGLWYAPNITSDKVSGIGAWTDQDIAQYLKTGKVAGKAQAGGGMAEAITHSLSKLTDQDIASIVTYLRAVPAVADPSMSRNASSWTLRTGAGAGEARIRGTGLPLSDGHVLYDGVCASCHGTRGEGSADQYYPSLVNNSTVGAATPQNLIATILTGVDREVAGEHTVMPHFSTGSYVQRLSDEEVASVATYVREQFGPGDSVSAADVRLARAGGPRPLLMTLTTYGLPLGGLAIIALGIWIWRRRAARKRRAL